MILRRERGPSRQAASPPCERRRPAANATGGESFGRSLRRSNDSPEGCGSWTRRSSEPPLAEKPLRCTKCRRRGNQAASDTESAPICTGLPGTHKASCALPRCTAAGRRLRKRPKRDAQQRARCGVSGDTGQRGELFFPHMRNSRRVALCGVSHRRKVESGATGQRGELSFPICGTAAARNCRDGANRLMEDRFRGTRQRAIRRRRLHRRSHYDQLQPPTMWSERRYPLMIE